MRYLCISSVCIHGLLAFSIGQYTPSSLQPKHMNFSLTLLTSPGEINKKAPCKVECISTSSTPKPDLKLSKIISLENVNTTKNNPHIASSITEASAVTPAVIYNPAPTYPARAKANGQEGEFSIKLRVNTAGNVEHIEVISIKGNKELFEEELHKTIKTWKFSPCSKELFFEVPISFQLN